MTLQLRLMHHHTNFGYRSFSGSGHIIQQTLIEITFTVTLTLITAIHVFTATLWLMVIYHQTNFGSKRIISSEHIFNYISSHSVILTWKIATIFSLPPYDILAHDDAPAYNLWLQEVKPFRRYALDIGHTDTAIFLHLGITIVNTNIIEEMNKMKLRT